MEAMNKIISEFSQRHCQRTGVEQNNKENVKERGLKVFENAVQSLSKEGKDRLQLELHGTQEEQQPSIIEETPEFMDRKLEELDKEISNLTDSLKDAYTEAVKIEREKINAAAAEAAEHRSREGEEETPLQDNNKNKGESNSRCYVTGRKLRLMFLRAERYNARLAARRLARCFQEKSKLFGREKLACPIKQSDLDENDLNALKSGGFVVPGGLTDKAGRLMVLTKRSRRDGFDSLNMKRAVFYLMHSFVEKHEAAQRNGIVVVGFNVGTNNQRGSFSEQRSTHFPIIRLFFSCLPFRVVALHILYNDLREHIIMNLFGVIFATDIRRRMIPHFASHEEGMLQLKGYGIDVDVLPLTEDGNFSNEAVRQYLEERCKEEETSC